jgi:hypothetical protein
MKRIYELVAELRTFTPFDFCQRFDPTDMNLGVGQLPDFERWLLRLVNPSHQFASLDAAYDAYNRSFG